MSDSPRTPLIAYAKSSSKLLEAELEKESTQQKSQLQGAQTRAAQLAEANEDLLVRFDGDERGRRTS